MGDAMGGGLRADSVSNLTVSNVVFDQNGATGAEVSLVAAVPTKLDVLPSGSVEFTVTVTLPSMVAVAGAL